MNDGTLFELPGVDDRIEQAVNLIRAIGKHNSVMVSFSGGKDSIVLEWLVRQSDISGYEVVYCNTGNEPPDVIKFVRQHYPHVRIIRPEHSWFHLLGRYGLPTRYGRWCCKHQKERPLAKYANGRPAILGLRAEESLQRRRRKAIERSHIKKGAMFINPMLTFVEGDVWHIIDRERLAVPDLYDAGFHRVGCVVCPSRRAREHALWRARYPRYFEVFELFAARSFERRSLGFCNVNDLLRWWYAGCPTPPPKSAATNAQRNLFAM